MRFLRVLLTQHRAWEAKCVLNILDAARPVAGGGQGFASGDDAIHVSSGSSVYLRRSRFADLLIDL